MAGSRTETGTLQSWALAVGRMDALQHSCAIRCQGYSCQEIGSLDQMENADPLGASLFTGLNQNIARNTEKKQCPHL